MSMQRQWTKVEIDEICARMRRGEYASKVATIISNRFGGVVTKNQIIGVWNRHKKIGEVAEIQLSRRRPAQRSQVDAFREDWGGVKGRCQWLHGDPDRRDFCGKQTAQGDSYCEEHQKIVYTHAQPKDEQFLALVKAQRAKTARLLKEAKERADG